MCHRLLSNGSKHFYISVANASKDVMVNSIGNIHDVDTMTEYGNDLVDVTEQLNEAFGSLLIIDVLTSITICTFGAYVFLSLMLSIFYGVNDWFVVIIGLSGLGLSLLFVWKLKGIYLYRYTLSASKLCQAIKRFI